MSNPVYPDPDAAREAARQRGWIVSPSGSSCTFLTTTGDRLDLIRTVGGYKWVAIVITIEAEPC